MWKVGKEENQEEGRNSFWAAKQLRFVNTEKSRELLILRMRLGVLFPEKLDQLYFRISLPSDKKDV